MLKPILSFFKAMGPQNSLFLHVLKGRVMLRNGRRINPLSPGRTEQTDNQGGWLGGAFSKGLKLEMGVSVIYRANPSSFILSPVCIGHFRKKKRFFLNTSKIQLKFEIEI